MTFQLADKASDIYEKVMVPLWFERWALTLMDVAALRPRERVLDLACGTGVTTRLAKQAVGPEGRVTGLDINANMLAIARGLAQDQDITWLERDVCRSGLPNNQFDAVISQHGYHYFPDKPRALAEIHRMLTPKGRLVFSIWNGHSAYTSALCEAVAAYISPEVAAKQRSQRETPDANELEQDLVRAGFRDVRVELRSLEIHVPPVREFVPLHLSSMPIAAAFEALPETRQERLIVAVEDALRDYLRGDELIYTDVVNVAVGHK